MTNSDTLISQQITTLAAKLLAQAAGTGQAVLPKTLAPEVSKQAHQDISAILLERAFEARSKGAA